MKNGCAGWWIFSPASHRQHHPRVPRVPASLLTLYFPAARSPVRSPAAGAAFHRSTEDLRMRQSASYGRLRKPGMAIGQNSPKIREKQYKIKLQREQASAIIRGPTAVVVETDK